MAIHQLRPSKVAAALVAGGVILASCGSGGTGEEPTETSDEVTETDSEASGTATDDETNNTADSNIKSVDIDLFFDGALETEAAEVDCTLSDGTETSCYEITVVGDPANRTDGPYCPPTTSSSAEEGGTWFDGDNFYDVDGQFILDLPEIYGDEKWTMHDEDGNVDVLDPEVFLNADGADPGDANIGKCVMAAIADLPDGPVSQSVTIPKTPTLAETSVDDVRGGLGVTLDGVKIEGPAPIDLILSTFSLGVFDDCGGHVNPSEGYHIHGAVECDGVDVENHSKMFGYALDGIGIYYNSEDSDLDECGGHETDELGYHYHANKPEVNSVLDCLSGMTVEGQDGGGGGERPEGGPGGGGPPSR